MAWVVIVRVLFRPKKKTKLLEHYISLNFNFARSFFKFANTGFGLPAS